MANNSVDRKNRRYLLALIILVIALIAISFFIIGYQITGRAVDHEDDKLRVGAILTLSGQDAYFGDIIKKSLVLANNNELELIIEDFSGISSNAPSAVNKLVNLDKIDILLTEFSEDTMASIEIINQNKIPTICISCGSAGITKESNYLFRTWPSDEIEVKALVNYAEDKGYEKVAILQTISVWEESLVKSFKDNFPGEVIVLKANREDSDFKTQLIKIKKFKPDFIYLACYEQKYPLIFKQLKELGIDSYAEIATTTWINDPNILKTCGKNCENVIVPQYAKPSQDFVNLYKQEYGEEPGVGADVAYDAIQIIKILKSRNNKDIVRELLDIEYTGASGFIEFDSTGDRKNRDVELFRIRDRELRRFG
ncbi:ABC transporter substrate-binding protein [Candidatus Pacearchaeota archaeon]|nr:ABC transporter substrate-binding protein [Candidatus Pacearchaeota archaeon]MBD3282937.1 ABC transporter substrate-binding protein [Candidatus Pacearchaeota archaeon]